MWDLTTVSGIRAMLESKPEDKWITDRYDLGDCHCAIGFLRKETRESDIEYDDFRSPSIKFLQVSSSFLNNRTVFNVNDGGNPFYQQPTPKQRVLALCDDMLAAGIDKLEG